MPHFIGKASADWGSFHLSIQNLELSQLLDEFNIVLTLDTAFLDGGMRKA